MKVLYRITSNFSKDKFRVEYWQNEKKFLGFTTCKEGWKDCREYEQLPCVGGAEQDWDHDWVVQEFPTEFKAQEYINNKLVEVIEDQYGFKPIEESK